MYFYSCIYLYVLMCLKNVSMYFLTLLIPIPFTSIWFLLQKAHRTSSGPYPFHLSICVLINNLDMYTLLGFKQIYKFTYLSCPKFAVLLALAFLSPTVVTRAEGQLEHVAFYLIKGNDQPSPEEDRSAVLVQLPDRIFVHSPQLWVHLCHHQEGKNSRSRGWCSRIRTFKWFQIYIGRNCHSMVRNLSFIHFHDSTKNTEYLLLFPNIIHLLFSFPTSTFWLYGSLFSLLYILSKGYMYQLYAKKPQNVRKQSTVYVFICHGFQNKCSLFLWEWWRDKFIPGCSRYLLY